MRTKAAWIRRLTILGVLGLVLVGGCGGAGSAVNSPSGSASVGLPSIRWISPTSAAAGSPDLSLTIMGSNLDPGPGHGSLPQAVWSANGSNAFLATTVVSSTQLTAVIPEALMSAPVTAQVFVEGGSVSLDTFFKTNSVSFSVPTPAPNFTLLIGDTPPPGVTVLSFSLTITGAVLFNDPLDPNDQGTSILQNPVTVELSRLQTDTALLASVWLSRKNYRFLSITFANPALTILNSTGAAIGPCANGEICKSKPVPSVSSVLLSASVDQSPLLLDFDVSKSLSTDLSSITPVVIVRQLGAPGSKTIARFKQLSGKVTDEWGDSDDGFGFSMTTPIGSVIVDDNSTTYVDAGDESCRVSFFGEFYCLVGRTVEVDSRILTPAYFEARMVTVVPSNQSELEGLLIVVNGANQFDMVVLHEAPDVVGVEVGDLVHVSLPVGATIEIVDTDLARTGLLFSAPVDMQVGQVVSLRLQSVPSGPSLTVTADRVRLKTSEITARIKSIVNATDFVVDSLPEYFSMAEIQVRTNTIPFGTDFINATSVGDLQVGNTISLSGFLLKSSDGPVLLADAVRKR